VNLIKKLLNVAGHDPRDMVGENDKGRPRKSSAKKRRQAERKMLRDLDGTPWEVEDGEEGNET
jgi:hypothetical protein